MTHSGFGAIWKSLTHIATSEQGRAWGRRLKSRTSTHIVLPIGLAALLGLIIWPSPHTSSARFASAKTNDSNSTASASLLGSHSNSKSGDFDLSRYDLYLDDPLMDLGTKTEITLRSGDSLGPLLKKNGVSGPDAYRITQAFAEVYDPRRLKVGDRFSVYKVDAAVRHLTYKPNVEKTIFISKRGDDYQALDIEANLKYDYMAVSTEIVDSLYLDANRQGVPDKIIQQFASIYEYSVDFQRDIRKGDAFEMFFEVARDHKGNVVKAGDLLYTSFSPRGNTSTYYLYEDSQGRENFYDAKGKTAKRKLRATPINGARLSSRFGKRRHPILGYVKNHKGVDFAAPRGTPILAAGTGVVERANRYGSFGNYVRIRHSDGYKTAYAHLKGFAKGIKAGTRVRQDQIIGYVGTTGRSTGPHLHYEVIKNGRHVNPRSLAQLSGRPLAASELPAFEKRRAEIDNKRQNTQPLSVESLLTEAIPEAGL